MKINYLSSLALFLMVVGCTNEKVNSSNCINEAASLSANDSLSFNPLEWIVIYSEIDKNAKTMATLYGNDMAVSYARAGGYNNYPSGTQLSMVTWKQREDEHWFGGNIPDSIQSVEIIKFEEPMQRPGYKIYKGTPLRIDNSIDSEMITRRIGYISSQKASVIP